MTKSPKLLTANLVLTENGYQVVKAQTVKVVNQHSIKTVRYDAREAARALNREGLKIK